MTTISEPSRGRPQFPRGGGGGRFQRGGNQQRGGGGGGPIRNQRASADFGQFRGNNYYNPYFQRNFGHHHHSQFNQHHGQVDEVARVIEEKVRLSVHATDRLKTDSSVLKSVADNPAANKSCFLSLGSLDPGTANSSVRCDLNTKGKISFFADKRISQMTFTLPKNNLSLPDFPSNIAVTASFAGKKCSVCPGHWLDDQTPCLFLLGDQHCPAACGSLNDCAPVIRVQSGSFAQLRQVMMFQKSLGWRPANGSIAVTMLLTHLFRVGEAKYWAELKNFAKWCADNIDLKVLPCIPPYPCYDTHMITAIRQFTARLQALHTADNTKGCDVAFSLWEVLSKVCSELKVKLVDIPTPSMFIDEVGKGTAVKFVGKFLDGLDEIWDKGMPSKIEISFLKHLCAQVTNIIENTGAKHITMPTMNSIKGAVDVQTSELDKFSGKTIYIMGSSIIMRTQETLENITRRHQIDVIPICKAGDYKTHYFKQDRDEYLACLTSATKDDIVVISFLGNHLLSKRSFYPEDLDKEKRVWHMKDPELLTEEAFNLLMTDVSHMLKEVRDRFPGSIYLIGPFPRYFENCCGIPSHQIVDDLHEPVTMLSYTDVFNVCLAESITIPNRCDVIHFKEIFGSAVPPSLVRDHIHLGDTYKLKFAQFISKLLLRTPTIIPRKPAENRPSFSNRLSAEKISISPSMVDFEADSDTEKKDEDPDTSKKAAGGEKAAAGKKDGGSTIMVE